MKRNRAHTEERIAQAAVDLILQGGFHELGINHVAARSGVDKVLIYRYFKGLDGLMEHIAASTDFFPPAATLFPEEATDDLSDFVNNYRKALQSRPLTRVLLAWRTTADNPLTRAVSEHRQRFWREVEDFAHPAGEADRAFLGCLRPVLEDSVPEADVFVALANFSFAPVVPAEARARAVERISAAEAPEEELPTNLL